MFFEEKKRRICAIDRILKKIIKAHFVEKEIEKII